MEKETSEKIRQILAAYPEIKLAYLFGSRATGKAGPMSDYDFAVYMEAEDARRMYNVKFDLEARLQKELSTNAVEVTILNFVESPELKYFIIKEGILIAEREPFKVIVEPRILNDYFDFHSLLIRYGLTKV
jgi:predicted nucleotidyltransferase